MKNKTLLLVDGSSYLYRAYYAMPNLRNQAQEPTGAIFGMINMMRRIQQDFHPDYMVCVFDAPGKTFRDELYPDYKGQRPPMPDDLRVQIEPIYETITALGWPVIAQPGVEADDIIATLAEIARQNDVKTIISTGDKDIAQLVDDHISLINTMTGERLDRDGVKQKFGVYPEQIIDFLMLVGDKVDNVPGVEKVGEKTAAKWLGEYGNLDNLIANADKLTGKIGENFRKAIGQFDLTRQLITIKRDCDMSEFYTGFEQLQPKPEDKEKLIALFNRFGFKTFLREVSGDANAIPTQDARIEENLPEVPTTVQYEMVNTDEQLQACLKAIQAAEAVAFDTETNSLDSMQAKLVGISLSIKVGQAWYIPLAHTGLMDQQLDKKQVLTLFRSWLESDKPTKILQNAKFDAHVLANEGITLRGVKHDTMLMAYVLASHQKVNLEELASRYLGRKGLSFEEICGKGASAITFDQVPLDKATQYACEDADFTFQVAQVLLPRIEANIGYQQTYALEMQVWPVLLAMERVGVKLDEQELFTQSMELGQRLTVLEGQAFELAGQEFNLNSPKQLGEVLFDKLHLPVLSKTSKGAPSTDEETLTKLAQDYPLPKLILEYRSLAKLKSTYTDKLPQMIFAGTGRVHTNYAQAAVVTGRLSSSDPNLQNIPIRTEEGRRVRKAFIAEQGFHIMSADYSQIELRVMAHLSGDANLQKAFAEGKDIHRATAAEVFGVSLEAVTSEQRRAAKAINFGLIYGMGAFGLASNLGITREAAQNYIARYFARYPGVAAYMEKTRAKANELGYVETVFGRRLWLPEIKGAKGPRKAAAERAAINAPMQGTAADLIKKAMVAVQNWLAEQGLTSRMIMQVHDELVLEVKDDEATRVREHLPRLMAEVANLAVPLLAEVGEGKNWGDAH
ncbi:DNA polymerase I [Pelistega europaea]|uniref:DNA polymerase I n=1 Tax=Pelistega europaea TaxID=106147 RepID=A0A7Y4LAB5_9BURK|nr:DNA polymerase I [Pelistega europaea]NOL49880.1 DNA polymerase I [Pelistega europaea]